MTKYNAKKTVIDNITFDSKAEGEYYLYLKERVNNKEITIAFTQPAYILQETFEKNGKKFREIKYIADFELYYPDGKIEVVDVKGFETADFKIKRKLFEKKYPHLTLVLMKYVKKYGGWITVDEWKRRKKEEKKK